MRRKYVRHKQDSKRRWKARYRLGKDVPWIFVVIHGLHGFVKGGLFQPYTDCVKRPG